MRHTHVEEALDQIAFAKKAAQHFSVNAKSYTYTEDDIEMGCLLAIRWGGNEDCVLVCKLSAYHEPVNYMKLIMKQYCPAKTEEASQAELYKTFLRSATMQENEATICLEGNHANATEHEVC